MTGKIAGWTPDRPPTPDEVEDAYRVAGMLPVRRAELCYIAARKCGCGWGAITEAKRMMSPYDGACRNDISRDLLAACGKQNVSDFMNGFDACDLPFEADDIDVSEWERAGAAAGRRMFGEPTKETDQ